MLNANVKKISGTIIPLIPTLLILYKKHIT
jgi:hypothetical protein